MANYVAGATDAWRQPHGSRPASWRKVAAELTGKVRRGRAALDHQINAATDQ
jgi:hypothetical protein